MTFLEDATNPVDGNSNAAVSALTVNTSTSGVDAPTEQTAASERQYNWQVPAPSADSKALVSDAFARLAANTFKVIQRNSSASPTALANRVAEFFSLTKDESTALSGAVQNMANRGIVEMGSNVLGYVRTLETVQDTYDLYKNLPKQELW